MKRLVVGLILSFDLEWLDVSIVVSCSVAHDLRTQVDELKDSCPAFILPRLEQSETAIDLTCPGYRVGRTTPRFTAGLMLRCFSEDMTQTWKSKRRRRSLPRYQWYMPLAGVMSCQDQLRQFFNSAKYKNKQPMLTGNDTKSQIVNLAVIFFFIPKTLIESGELGDWTTVEHLWIRTCHGGRTDL